MDSLNTNHLLSGALLFSGAYFVVRAGSRLYRTVTSSPKDGTKVAEARDVVLQEVCTLSMGSLGAALILGGLVLSKD